MRSNPYDPMDCSSPCPWTLLGRVLSGHTPLHGDLLTQGLTWVPAQQTLYHLSHEEKPCTEESPQIPYWEATLYSPVGTHP